MPVADLTHQANLFSRYLIKRDATPLAIEQYARAINTARVTDATDQKLLKFVERHVWSIGLVDAGLVFIKPASEVRRRLYVLSALLEASPEYHADFLATKRSPLYLLVIVYYGIRSALKAIVGIILVKVVCR